MSAPANEPYNDPVPRVEQPDRKKKKKKKTSNAISTEQAAKRPSPDTDRPSVLCISRNKHWKYISSYHGPWLQLPLELLESLLVVNLQPATLANPRIPTQPLLPSRISSAPTPTRALARPRDIDRPASDNTPLDAPRRHVPSYTPPNPPIWPIPGKPTPPPIDPGVFRNVATIRRLIDEAAELSVRAASGLSSAGLGSIRGVGHGPWPTSQNYGLDGSTNLGGGRNVTMSAMRIHRLRALAVQKLAAAYKADEIASSVMVMQGGSVFDDIAERVLKHDPDDADAKYVHFFHEKIPSRANRQLAESTTTQVLDELIAAHPQRLEYYRTRGIVYCFRDEYILAARDFSYALKEARAARKGRTAHRSITLPLESCGKNGKKKKGIVKTTGRAPPNGTSDSTEGSTVDGPDGEPLSVHPSVLPDAPDPIEPQLLFLRGATYLQHALHLIESAILRLEGVSKHNSTTDGTELRLCYLPNSRYGGVEIGNPNGPLGKSDGPKLRAYRGVLAEAGFCEDISGYLRKCIRDHERFLSHFDSDTLEGLQPAGPTDLPRKVEIAFLLSETGRAWHQNNTEVPHMYTTYHPLLVESHFTILLCQLMLADFPTLLGTFAHAAVLVNSLEGYPVFLPPRSMAQAEFIEVLERLAAGWKPGVQPHAAMRAARGRMITQAPAPAPVPAPAPAPLSPSGSLLEVMSSWSGDTADSALASPSSSSSLKSPVHVQQAVNEGAEKRADLANALNSARVLLVPVAARQHARAVSLAQMAAAQMTTTTTTTVASGDKASSTSFHALGKKKPLNINIPLHGPRVEIILAWLAAVHLVELESVA